MRMAAEIVACVDRFHYFIKCEETRLPPSTHQRASGSHPFHHSGPVESQSIHSDNAFSEHCMMYTGIGTEETSKVNR